MIRLRVLLLLCVLLTACSKDEPEANDPEQEQHDDGDDPEGDASFLINVSTNENYLSAVAKSYLYITDLDNNLIGDFLEVKNNLNQSKIDRPDSFTDDRFNLHQLTISTFERDGIPINTILIRSYLNIKPTTVNLRKDRTTDCNTIASGSVKVTLMDISDFSYGSMSYNDCSKSTLSNPVSFSDFGYFYIPNTDVYIHLKDFNNLGSYVRFSNINDGDEYQVTGTDFNTDMTLVSPNFNAPIAGISVTEVDNERYDYKKLFMYRHVRNSDDPDDMENFNYYLPNDDDDAIYRTEAVHAEGIGEGSYNSISYNNKSTLPDIGILNGQVIVSNPMDPFTSSYKKQGDGDILMTNFYGYDGIEVNGNMRVTNSAFYQIINDGSNHTYQYPAVPAVLANLYPESSGDLLINGEFGTCYYELIDSGSHDTYEGYVKSLLKSDRSAAPEVRVPSIKRNRNNFYFRGIGPLPTTNDLFQENPSDIGYLTNYYINSIHL